MNRIGPTRLLLLARIMEGAARRFPMSFREIQMRMGYQSLNGVAGHVRALRKAGLVRPSGPHEKRTLMPAVRFIPAEEIGPIPLDGNPSPR